MFFLDLHFHHIAWVLDDLGDIRLVSSSDLAGNPLSQIRKSSIHPVLPEDTDTVAERRKIGFDHAESTMDGPEYEEDDEKMMRVPESLELGSSRLFGCRHCHCREGNQHNVSGPSGAGCKIR